MNNPLSAVAFVFILILNSIYLYAVPTAPYAADVCFCNVELPCGNCQEEAGGFASQGGGNWDLRRCALQFRIMG